MMLLYKYVILENVKKLNCEGELKKNLGRKLKLIICYFELIWLDLLFFK